MSVNALAEFFNLSDRLKNWYPDDVPLPEKTVIECPADGTLEEKLLAAVSHSYNIAEDSLHLRCNAGEFEKLRGNYPLRRESGVFTVCNADAECAAILRKLGFNIN